MTAINEFTLSELQALSERGINFSIEVDAAAGGRGFCVTPEQALRYLSHPDTITAECWGVTVEQLRQCVAQDFIAMCSGLTKLGKPCKNMVPGGFQVNPPEWVALQGSFCTVHTQYCQCENH